MMRANGIRLLQSHVDRRPLSTMTLQRSSRWPLSHHCSPCCSPMGELVWALSQGDADAQPCEVPDSSKATLGTMPSWDSWCHRGISAFGRLTECPGQKGIWPPEGTLSLQSGACQKQHNFQQLQIHSAESEENVKRDISLSWAHCQSSLRKWTKNSRHQGANTQLCLLPSHPRFLSASSAKAQDVDGAKTVGGAILFWLWSVIFLYKWGY